MPDFHLIDRLRDLADQASEQGYLSHTYFLSPAQQTEAGNWLHKNRITHAFSGGYKGAERQVCFFLPDYMGRQGLSDHETALVINALALKTPARAAFQLSHRDYLGSLLGLGIRREQVGDILVGENEATVLMLAAMAPFVENQLDRIGSLHVEISAAALADIQVTEKNSISLRVTVASPRLDKVAASGFSISRTQMADFIRSGAVQVNWQEELRPDRELAIGAVVSLRGHGRICLKSEDGYSRKNRRILILERFL